MSVVSAASRPTYDVVVIGLGIMGASTLYHLSRRGVRVLGIEARGPMHTVGSSRGCTRIFRRAYWEGDHYTPLLERSYAGWLELDDAAEGTIASRTGGIFVGSAASKVVQGSRTTALRSGLNHEYLDASEISDRFPAFHVRDDEVAVYEPDALMLFAETARLDLLTRAVDAGAEVVYGHAVRSIKTEGDRAVTVFGDGWRIACGEVVLTVGGWAGGFLPEEIAPLITPMRIPVYELDVAESSARDYQPDRFPVFLYEDDSGALVYGLPKWRAVDGGLRIGFHNRQLSPLALDDERAAPTEEELRELWGTVSNLFPGLRCSGRKYACVYTMSTDEGFFLGRSRELDHVSYVSACSGHGFKFAPGIGEAMAQFALDGRSELDLSVFGPERLRPTSGG